MLDIKKSLEIRDFLIKKRRTHSPTFCLMNSLIRAFGLIRYHTTKNLPQKGRFIVGGPFEIVNSQNKFWAPFRQKVAKQRRTHSPTFCLTNSLIRAFGLIRYHTTKNLPHKGRFIVGGPGETRTPDLSVMSGQL